MTSRTFSPHGVLTHLFTNGAGDIVALHRGPQGDAVLTGVPGEPLRRIPIDKLQVMRDGGTTIAATAEGTLHVPSALRAREEGTPGTPKWKGASLTPAPESHYDIDLSGRPTIAPKASAAPAP